MPVRAIRKVRRLTFPNFFTTIRAIIGLSVVFWWPLGSPYTYTVIGSAILTAWIAWLSEASYKQIAPLSSAINPLADKFFILPVFWYVGITTVNEALIILTAYTTWYDIAMSWQRRVALSLAWRGVTLLHMPTTVLSRVKTVCQYLLVFMLATDGIGLYTTIAIIVTMVMTVVSWASHQNQNL